MKNWVLFQDQNPIEESGTVDVRYKLAGPYLGIWRIIFRFRIAESRFNDEFPSKLYQEKKKSRNLFNIFSLGVTWKYYLPQEELGPFFKIKIQSKNVVLDPRLNGVMTFFDLQ